MNLYELTGAYKALETAIALNPDIEEFKAELDKISDDIETKADGYAKLIRNLESDILAIDSELSRLQGIKQGKANAIDRLKSNLMESMKQTGKTKFKTELFSFGVAGNGGLQPLVLTVKPEELPEEFQKVTIEADNKALRKYINETGDFSYAVLEERGEHLNIK